MNRRKPSVDFALESKGDSTEMTPKNQESLKLLYSHIRSPCLGHSDFSRLHRLYRRRH